MQRVNNELPLYRKITQGTLYPIPHKMNTRVKYKQEIRISEKDLGKWIDQFVLVEDGKGEYKTTSIKDREKAAKKETKENSIVPSKETFSVEKVEGGFNVMSSVGKKMNNTTLKKGDAKELVKQLEQESIEE